MADKKLVLLADDDEILRDGMKQILTAEGYEVRDAKSGKDAKELIEISNNFDLIVADAQLSIVDGLQLLNFARISTKSRFLLLSQVSELLQARHAKQLGADEFLNKPFTKADFILSVTAAFVANDPAAKAVQANDYVQVSISEFVTGSILSVDIYLKLTSSKFVRIGSKGTSIADERIQGYLAKGIQHVHLRNDDYAVYVGFNLNLAKKANSQESIEASRKIKLMKHVTETVITQMCASGLQREQLEDASSFIMNAVEMIGTNPNTMKLLEIMEFVGTLAEHSIAVGIWSCLIAKQVGWTGQQTFFKIALCALFHDIGQKEIDQKILAKPRFEMTHSEIKTFENHAIRGREILMSVTEMPEDIAIVALQHHELMHGGGYPYNLRLEQIHPMARLICVADQLCDLLRQSANGKEANLIQALEVLDRKRRDFDTIFVRALNTIVEEAVLKASA